MSSRAERAVETIFVAVMLIAVGGGIAFWMWPDGAMDTPMAALTVGTILRIIGAGVAVLITLVLLLTLIAS